MSNWTGGSRIDRTYLLARDLTDHYTHWFDLSESVTAWSRTEWKMQNIMVQCSMWIAYTNSLCGSGILR